ncbi:hypothetical protein HK405_013593, partial [Cladochytrium tenue]
PILQAPPRTDPTRHRLRWRTAAAATCPCSPPPAGPPPAPCCCCSPRRRSSSSTAARCYRLHVFCRSVSRPAATRRVHQPRVGDPCHEPERLGRPDRLQRPQLQL